MVCFFNSENIFNLNFNFFAVLFVLYCLVVGKGGRCKDTKDCKSNLTCKKKRRWGILKYCLIFSATTIETDTIAIDEIGDAQGISIDCLLKNLDRSSLIFC